MTGLMSIHTSCDWAGIDGETLAAAALVHHVGVAELEGGGEAVTFIIDLGTVDLLQVGLVDDHLDAAALEYLVVIQNLPTVESVESAIGRKAAITWSQRASDCA